jgi:hypothetical protein
MSKEEEGGKTSTSETSAPMPGSGQSATETTENVEAKDESLTAGGPVTEATEEAEANTSVAEQVKEAILEVAAPVAAAATAATAAVSGLFSGVTGGGDSSIPGTFPDTPAQERVIDAPSEPTAPMIDEVKNTDDEPIPGVVIAADAKEETHNLETIPLETGAGATASGGFAEALAADKAANIPPSSSEIPSGAFAAAPEKNESFGILPVPSETAPEGTKPLAKSVYKDEEKTANVGSIVPEPVKETATGPVPVSQDFEPVTNDSNVISSAKLDETAAAGVGAAAGAATATATTGTSHIEQLKEAALKSSEHAAQTAAKALSEDAPTPETLDANAALSSLSPGAGVTAIGTATDQESSETGLSRLVARKENEKVDVEAEAKAAEIEPAIVLDETKMGKPTVETLGSSGAAAVASTPVKVTVPTDDGVQQVQALGTAIVTDGGKTSQSLKNELLDSGKGTLPEGALAHLSKPEDTAAPPATPKKDAPMTPQKTPASISSAAKKENRSSMTPSERSSEPGSEKKKRGGFIRKLKKVFS